MTARFTSSDLTDPHWPVPDRLLSGLRFDDDHPDKAKKKSKRERDEELEEALEGTFPASDPVAVSQPTVTGGPEDHKRSNG